MPEGPLARQAALRALIAAADLDGLMVSSPANIRYLTGFTGSAGVLVVALRRSVLVTDFRYASQAPAEVGAGAEVRIERTSVWEGVRQGLAAPDQRRIGVGRGRATLAALDQLPTAPRVEARAP